jgi:hypothetical protein
MIVTSFNKNLYKEYAWKFIDSYIDSETTIPLHIYVEDSLEYYPEFKTLNITLHNLFEEASECQSFVQRNSYRQPTNYMKDGVRFCYKVFAQYLGSKLGNNMLWVDADSVFLNKIDEEWVSNVLDNKFVAFFDRPGMYTECGFMAYDLTKPCSGLFFEHFKNMYVSDSIYSLPSHTDCHAFDYVRNVCKRIEGYSENPLGQYKKHRKLHVMALDPFMSQYIDHRKGNRKQKEKSPELL